MQSKPTALAVTLLATVLFALGTLHELARFFGYANDPLPNPLLLPALGLIAMLALLRWIWLAEHSSGQLANGVLLQYAYYDALTRLPNRILLQDRLTVLLASIRRTGSCAALLMVDLDGFKQVNDTMGHRLGDQLLVEVAQRLLAACRETDTVARLGGDEFVILHAVDEEPQAAVLARRIVETLSEPFSLPKGQIVIGCSIGVTITRDPDSTLEDLIDRADVALYQSKKQGGNQLNFFEQGLNPRPDVPVVPVQRPEPVR